MSKLVVWGASGHALVVADIIKLRGEFDLVGFVDDVNPVHPSAKFCGLPLYGGDDIREQLCRGDVNHVVLGFGNCQARSKLADWSRRQGLLLATAIHPSAVIAESVSVGAGTVIAAGAIINPNAVIGENVIVNTGATVDHECFIGDAAHICPGVHLAGNVSIGRETWVGIGSTVIDHVRIGAHAVIGAGSVVVKEIPDNSLSYGVPAKVIKNHEIG